MIRVDIPLPGDFEVHHHPRGMMLEDVAVCHPWSGTIVWQPRDLHEAHRRHMHRVFPRAVLRALTIDRQHLKKKPCR
jgi:hypothetical protein